MTKRDWGGMLEENGGKVDMCQGLSKQNLKIYADVKVIV